MRFSLLGSGLLLAASAMAQIDVAPFGRPLSEENAVGIQWSEMRRIIRVEVDFAPGAALPPANELKIEYWRHVWDGSALRRYAERGAGGVGWAAMDDWFNGEWKTAAAQTETRERTVAFTFASSEQEFPALATRGVRYRPTLKIRIALPGARSRIAALRAFTDSAWRTAELNIRLEGQQSCDEPLEIYNGRLISKHAETGGSDCSLRASVSYAFNPEDSEADRTIVTARRAKDPFSFAVDEAERGDRIYIKDLGALVTRASDPIGIAEYRRILEESGARTVYDRVAAESEQTLERAWNDMPLKRPYYFILGCEGGRQRFRLNPDGSIWMGWPDLPKGERRTASRFLWPEAVMYEFGLPPGHFADRTIAEGYLPIVTTRWTSGDLVYEQEAFADVLAANLNSGPPMEADDPTVALLKIRIVNTAAASRRAELNLSSRAQGRHDGKPGPVLPLHADGDLVLGSYEGRDVVRYQVDTRGSGALANAAAGVTYSVDLPAHSEHAIWLKLPFTLNERRDIDRLRSLDPERERDEVARYWRRRVAAGSEIVTPEPWLNDFYKAQLTHLLINDERELGANRYVARVGSFNYGAFGNESIMMISDLDRRGYRKEAERSLELFLHYQGTVPLPGTFSTAKGELYGAGGYEEGGYNQHHGWILWGLAEHWWHTRDRSWMQRAAPKMLDACRWIVEERKRTQLTDPQGRRVPEYGLLPAGSLEDITDYWFWVSTNSFTWWGLEHAAAALRDFGDPQGEALLGEAAKYREDILAAYREAMVRSPVVRLRDGTYVPAIPSNVYTRGRSYGWLRETLEGAIMLPITRLLDPASRETLWILKDYEDNRYISDRFGYSIPVFDQFWFSRGGFSMQPNLLHGPLPYFYRDDIPNFVRAYFNPFAAGYEPTLRMLPEHPLPELGYFVGDHFKTSDESQSTYWLRLMFASELDGELHLGRGIPRYWLRGGQKIAIRNASTYFGKLSYEMQSETDARRISMTLDAPARNTPKQIVVRFRHPDARQPRSVTVNGRAWRDFDPVKGDIRLPGALPGRTTIVANY